MHRTQNLTVSAADTDDTTPVVTPADILRGAATYLRPARPAAPAADLGFGYSREPDIDEPGPVPAGVDLYFFTGRTPKGRAA